MDNNETKGNIEKVSKDIGTIKNEKQPIPQPTPAHQAYQASQHQEQATPSSAQPQYQTVPQVQPQAQYQTPQAQQPQRQYQSTQQAQTQYQPTPTPQPQTQPQYQAPQTQYYAQPQQSVKSTQEKAKIGAGKTIALVAACAIAAGGATWSVNTFMPHATTTTTATSSSVDSTKYVNQDNDTNLANAVAATGTKSVVSIYTYVNQSSTNSYGSIYDYFFNGSSNNSNSGSSSNNAQSGNSTLSGLGSGVIIRSDGYIITNYHVIEDADSLKVEIDGTEYDGTVVGGDATSDIAVVKVDKTGLPAIEIADSSNIQVGDWVMAIGSPRGYEETVTTGIISALGRSTSLQSSSGTSIYANLIQTDASINSGNSGGALLDENAKLIGINTLISSESGDSSGLGFAIPSDYAINIANQIIEKGKVQHAKLGVTLTSSTDPMGATIKDISVDSAADKAGLKSGDIITKFGDENITTANELVYAVYGHLVNDEVEVTYIRDGKESTCKLVLGANETDSTVSKQSSSSSSYSRP